MDGQGTKCRRNIAENYNRLSRVHERYRQTTRETFRELASLQILKDIVALRFNFRIKHYRNLLMHDILHLQLQQDAENVWQTSVPP